MILRRNPRFFAAGALLAALAVVWTPSVSAHCDTLDGPVVSDARAALDAGDVTPVLKWIGPGKEAELRAAFKTAVSVRKLSPEAKELADRSFFEILVRVHREGEGAAYTGLRPAGTVEPAVAKADAALAAGTGEDLAKLVGTHASEGLRSRYARVAEAKKHAGESVEKGRAYVAAYVDYVHWVEGVVNAVHAGAHAHGGARPSQAAPAHAH